MNNSISWLLFVIILLNQPLFAGDDTSYFPHHQGNIWVYEVISWDGSFRYKYKNEVTFDSTDQNGNSYVIIKQFDPYNERDIYYKVDSLGNVYGTSLDFIPKTLRYKTAAEIGERWPIGDLNPHEYGRVDSIYSAMPFNTECQIKEFTFFIADSLNDPNDLFILGIETRTDKFGLLWRGGGEQFEDTYLEGAVIDGIVFGDTTIITDIPNNSKPDNNFSIIDFALIRQYPNPFNSLTIFKFDVYRSTKINLCIFDMLGREVIRLIENEKFSTGSYVKEWNGQNASGFFVSSSVYIYLIQSDNALKSGKIHLIR